MENEALVPKLTPLWDSITLKTKVKIVLIIVLALLLVVFFIFAAFQDSVPEITIPSMDFTVLNITETCLSVKWDLLIRIPLQLPGNYICLEGPFQASIVYKGVTIATSSIESYSLRPRWPKLLNISLIASEGDMDGVTVKDIMEDIKERGEMRFGSRLILPDCRDGTNGKMNYACDEAKLRFEPGSQRKATAFGNHPTRRYLH